MSVCVRACVRACVYVYVYVCVCVLAFILGSIWILDNSSNIDFFHILTPDLVVSRDSEFRNIYNSYLYTH